MTPTVRAAASSTITPRPDSPNMTQYIPCTRLGETATRRPVSDTENNQRRLASIRLAASKSAWRCLRRSSAS
jgi:hypothetical protein